MAGDIQKVKFESTDKVIGDNFPTEPESDYLALAQHQVEISGKVGEAAGIVSNKRAAVQAVMTGQTANAADATDATRIAKLHGHMTKHEANAICLSLMAENIARTKAGMNARNVQFETEWHAYQEMAVVRMESQREMQEMHTAMIDKAADDVRTLKSNYDETHHSLTEQLNTCDVNLPGSFPSKPADGSAAHLDHPDGTANTVNQMLGQGGGSPSGGGAPSDLGGSGGGSSSAGSGGGAPSGGAGSGGSGGDPMSAMSGIASQLGSAMQSPPGMDQLGQVPQQISSMLGGLGQGGGGEGMSEVTPDQLDELINNQKDDAGSADTGSDDSDSSDGDGAPRDEAPQHDANTLAPTPHVEPTAHTDTGAPMAERPSPAADHVSAPPTSSEAGTTHLSGDSAQAGSSLGGTARDVTMSAAAANAPTSIGASGGSFDGTHLSGSGSAASGAAVSGGGVASSGAAGTVSAGAFAPSAPTVGSPRMAPLGTAPRGVQAPLTVEAVQAEAVEVAEPVTVEPAPSAPATAEETWIVVKFHLHGAGHGDLPLATAELGDGRVVYSTSLGLGLLPAEIPVPINAIPLYELVGSGTVVAEWTGCTDAAAPLAFMQEMQMVPEGVITDALPQELPDLDHIGLRVPMEDSIGTEEDALLILDGLCAAWNVAPERLSVVTTDLAMSGWSDVDECDEDALRNLQRWIVSQSVLLIRAGRHDLASQYLSFGLLLDPSELAVAV